MDLRKAIYILEYHQYWMYGKVDEMPYKKTEIAEALGTLLASVKSNMVYNTDEFYANHLKNSFQPKI